MAEHNTNNSNVQSGAGAKPVHAQAVANANANGDQETDPLIIRNGSSATPQGYTGLSSRQDEPTQGANGEQTIGDRLHKGASGLGRTLNGAKLSTLRFCEKGWPFMIIILFTGIFFGLMAWFDVFYTCVIPDDAETITVNQTINAWDYKNLYFHLDKGVTGDVVLSQSRNWKEKDIQIFMSMRASTPDMMHYLTADLRLDVQQLAPKQRSIDGGRAESFIFINMESPDLTRALSRNCTQVKVNIVFPRNLEKFDSIEVQSTFGGSISVRTEDLQLRNKLTLSTTKGDVSVQDIRVKRETRLKTSNGKVVADNLGAGRSIEIEATGGADIELTGDNDELDANISTSSGKSIVLLSRPFYGHFKLHAHSSSHLPEIYSSQCCVYYHALGNHTAEGYISYDGYEPARLPRIRMSGDSATLRVRN